MKFWMFWNEIQELKLSEIKFQEYVLYITKEIEG